MLLSGKAGSARGTLVAAFTVALGLGLGLGLGACTTFGDDTVVIGPGMNDPSGDGSAGADEVVVDHTDGSVEITVGQTLVVDFGEINSSVGDEWELTQSTDDEVLGEGERASTYLGAEGSDGGRNTLVYEFEAMGAGETVLEFEYLFRGEVPEPGQGPDPGDVTLTVTVTEG